MKTPKRSKLNAIDAALIITLIFLVLASYMGTNKKKFEMLNIDAQPAKVTLTVPGEYESIIKNASLGQNIYLSESNICVGTITNIDKIYKENLVFDENGMISSCTETDTYSYLITLKTTVKKNNNGTYIQGELFAAPGKLLLVNIEGNKLNINSYIASISLR